MMRVREGDEDAADALTRQYQDYVQHTINYLLRGSQSAADLTQEVFLRVFRASSRYEPRAKFSTWLFTIANNVASNAKRSLSRRKEVNLAPGQSGAMGQNPLDHMAKAASGLMPTRQVDKAETAEIVRLAIESLNERQRMALLLSKFEGMSYIDIAETMGLTTQAIKSLLSRARNNLKTILEPYIHDGEKPASGGNGKSKPQVDLAT
jgi:RNA polymerase sigma-70 factor (ECF subfamily)